jgi:hypothetical protein
MKTFKVTKEEAQELWGNDYMKYFSKADVDGDAYRMALDENLKLKERLRIAVATFGKADVSDPLRGPRDEPDDKKVSERLLEAVNNMVTHNPSLKPEHAARWLMTTTQGQAFLAQHKSERNIPMQVDINKLSNIDSLTEVAKNIIADKFTLSEHEFTNMMMGHAKLNKRSGETTNAAFERILTDPENGELRKAYRISKGQPQTEA